MEGQKNKPKLSWIWRKLFNLVRGQLAPQGLRKVVTEGQANGTGGDQRWHMNVGRDVQQNCSSESKFTEKERVVGGPITIPVETPTGALKDIPVYQELPPQMQMQQNSVSEGNPQHGKSNEVWDINQKSEAYIKRRRNDLGTPIPPGTPSAPISAASPLSISSNPSSQPHSSQQ
ncbi:hypothetical protein ACLOJK_025896 [Asimina triloba]